MINKSFFKNDSTLIFLNLKLKIMKNVKCTIIDTLPTDWNFWRENRREEYDNFNEKFPDNIYFCQNILTDKPNFTTIQILRRIGSISADGEVYEISFSGKRFAIKL